LYIDVASRSSTGEYTILNTYTVKQSTIQFNVDTALGENTFTSSADAKAYRFRTVGSGAATYKSSGGYILRKKVTSTLLVNGAVKAEHVEAGSIRARHLEIGDTSNIFADPMLMDFPNNWGFISSANYNASVATVSDNALAFSPSRKEIRMAVGGVSVTGGAQSPAFPVEANKDYFVSLCIGAVNSNGITTNCTTRLNVRWFSDSAATTLISTSQIAETTQTYSTSTEPLSGQTKAPSNARSARIYATRVGNADHDGYTFSGPIVRRAADASLIVNGTITTDKLEAGQIITEDMIVDGAVSKTYYISQLTTTTVSTTTASPIGIGTTAAVTFAPRVGVTNPVLITLSAYVGNAAGEGTVYFDLQRWNGSAWVLHDTLGSVRLTTGSNNPVLRYLDATLHGGTVLPNATYRIAGRKSLSTDPNISVGSMLVTFEQVNK
jgi:hypothetical protein